MNKLLQILLLSILVFGCGGNSNDNENNKCDFTISDIKGIYLAPDNPSIRYLVLNEDSTFKQITNLSDTMNLKEISSNKFYISDKDCSISFAHFKYYEKKGQYWVTKESLFFGGFYFKNNEFNTIDYYKGDRLVRLSSLNNVSSHQPNK